MTPSFPLSILGLELINQGKTRDLFEVQAYRGPHIGKKLLLINATDRLSTHNVVHKSPIPFKGQVLTALTVHWLSGFFRKNGIPNHLVASGLDVYDYLDESSVSCQTNLYMTAIVVEAFKVIPIEFIFRARMGGSLYSKFYSKGLPNPYGLKLEKGLQLMSEFEYGPIFTPTEKSETDDPVTAEAVIRKYPKAYELTRRTFVLARQHLRERGIDLLDGKFEVGLSENGNPVIIDEVLTPDCCRFSRADTVKEGHEPPYLDKELARMAAIKAWGNGEKVPLEFSSDCVEELSAAYLKLVPAITGQDLVSFQWTHFCH